MSYIDGFLAAVPLSNRAAFHKHASDSAPLFTEFGALRVVDCWGDDVPKGKLTDMYMAVKANDDEVVCFSWVEWPSKEQRDAAWQKLMADPRIDRKSVV